MLTGLVRAEVDRAAGRLGFVREEELAAVRRHVSRLETQLAEVRTQIGAAQGVAPAGPHAAPAPVKKRAPVKSRVAPAVPAQPAEATGPAVATESGSDS